MIDLDRLLEPARRADEALRSLPDVGDAVPVLAGVMLGFALAILGWGRPVWLVVYTLAILAAYLWIGRMT